jgi:EmrB/QacA subfamily drug resistance transporter
MPVSAPTPTLTMRDQAITHPARPTRRAGLLAVILAAQLMVVLDTTIVNVALPHIQADLGFAPASLSWVLNAYLLTFGGFLLLGARAGDLVGRRRVFLLGIAIFTASSFAGGLAATGALLLAARAAQGLGAAMAAPSALALLTSTFPEGPARVRAIGLFTTVSAAGGALGLVAGGLLTELVSWRWVMFVNVPIGIAVLVAGRALLVETPVRHGRFDAVGALTSTIGMIAVVLGLVEASTMGWSSPLTIGALAVGVVLLATFLNVEVRASEPILPLRLFADRTRTAANGARGLIYAGMFGTFFFLGQFLQDVQGLSPMRAGVCFLPIPISVFASSQLVSRVLVGRVPTRTLMLAGAGLAATGLALATRIGAHTPYAQVVVSLVLLGLGAGTALVSLTSASLAGVPAADAGAAAGLVNVVQQVGAALGLAVLVTVESAVAPHASLAAGTASAAPLVHGLDVVFGVGALFAAAAFVLIAIGVRLPATTSSAPALDGGALDDARANRDTVDALAWAATEAAA